jgi:tetratricopeptide (TPR) repeat protein
LAMKSKFTCIFFLISFNLAYSEPEIISLADCYFSNGNYYAAITEYKRYLFFAPDSDQNRVITYKIGLAYRNDKKWNEAVDEFRKLSNFSDDSISYNARLQIAITYLASNQLDVAELELMRIQSFCNINSIKDKSSFFLGVCYLYKSNWVDAKENFNAFFMHYPSTVSEKLDSLLSLACKTKYKSPVVAKWLSAFVPGLGQLYGHDYKNGMNALVLNGLLGYFVVNSILVKQINDLLVIELALFERYYSGNRSRAEDIVVNYNSELNHSMQLKIAKELSLLDVK